MRDFPGLGLRRGDKLEPGAGLLDVADFDSASSFPVRAAFWRRDAESRVAFRNPLWDPEIGLTVASLAVDNLHTLFLGPALVFVGHCFWLFIDSDFWGLGDTASRDNRWHANLQNLRGLLRAF